MARTACGPVILVVSCYSQKPMPTAIKQCFQQFAFNQHATSTKIRTPRLPDCASKYHSCGSKRVPIKSRMYSQAPSVNVNNEWSQCNAWRGPWAWAIAICAQLFDASTEIPNPPLHATPLPILESCAGYRESISPHLDFSSRRILRREKQEHKRSKLKRGARSREGSKERQRGASGLPILSVLYRAAELRGRNGKAVWKLVGTAGGSCGDMKGSQSCWDLSVGLCSQSDLLVFIATLVCYCMISLCTPRPLMSTQLFLSFPREVLLPFAEIGGDR